jgi:hypothetical protein
MSPLTVWTLGEEAYRGLYPACHRRRSVRGQNRLSAIGTWTIVGMFSYSDQRSLLSGKTGGGIGISPVNDVR